MSTRRLWVHCFPFDEGRGIHWIRHLYVTRSERVDLAMQERDGVPTILTPDDARTLAAALLEGADEVEAARSAACWLCGTATEPTEHGLCLTCEVRTADLDAGGP